MKELFEKFIQFSSYCTTFSKDEGAIRMILPRWYGTQKFLIREIFKTLENEPHRRTFLILKGRQLGITTILQLFDLFWIMLHQGIRLALIFHHYNIRTVQRQNLRALYYSLPQHVRVPVIVDNRELFKLKNLSEIHFFSPTTRASSEGQMARSLSFHMMHASEVAFYPNWTDLQAIQAGLSELHPARLFIYESTANGYNYFFDMWKTAYEAEGIKNLFIGWWLKESNRIKRDDPMFKAYGYPLTREEKEWVKKVKSYYGYELDIEQIAFFRYQLYEKFAGDLETCLQEFPFTEDEAFKLSGMRYLDAQKLHELRKEVEKIEKRYYFIDWEPNKIQILPATARNFNFLVFELPQEGKKYVFGADPTFASNPNSDWGVISIWRAEIDGLYQVAEFASRSVDPITFARLIYLLGSLYWPVYLNLEITGPGEAVLKEMDFILRDKNKNAIEVKIPPELNYLWKGLKFNPMYEYLHYRADSLRPSFARHTKTASRSEKLNAFEFMKSDLNRGMLYIRSPFLIEELLMLEKDGDNIRAPSGYNDDRAVACALAVSHYHEYVLPGLLMKQRSQKDVVKTLLGVQR